MEKAAFKLLILMALLGLVLNLASCSANRGISKMEKCGGGWCGKK